MAPPPASKSRPADARRRGRPPSAELAAQRRQEIIEASYEVFAEKGYTAAGIADIAQRLDIGHGTFYRYFESKRDVLDHVVDYGVERVISAIQEDAAPDAADTLEEFSGQLTRIGEKIFELVDSEPGLVQVIMLEATSIDEEMTQRVMGLVDTVGAIAATYLDHGVRSGFLRADLDTEVAAHAIGALLIPGLVNALRGSFGPAERRRYNAGLLSLILDGTRAPAQKA
jgi:AcrR family transcriptional regulator